MRRSPWLLGRPFTLRVYRARKGRRKSDGSPVVEYRMSAPPGAERVLVLPLAVVEGLAGGWRAAYLLLVDPDDAAVSAASGAAVLGARVYEVREAEEYVVEPGAVVVPAGSPEEAAAAARRLVSALGVPVTIVARSGPAVRVPAAPRAVCGDRAEAERRAEEMRRALPSLAEAVARALGVDPGRLLVEEPRVAGPARRLLPREEAEALGRGCTPQP